MRGEKSSNISNAVFILTLIIVTSNVVSVLFPAIITLTNNSEGLVSPFELGIWAIPFLATNLILLGFGLLYYTKILPNMIRDSIRFILNVEVSRKLAIIIIVILVGSYTVLTAQELRVYEEREWPDFKHIKKALKDYPSVKGDQIIDVVYVKNFLLYTSQTIFDNIKILPFIASISLLLLTYFFTVAISKKRFSGLVSLVIMLQSHTFLQYDTTATYSNFWTLFYVLSLYMIYKKWYLSPFAYFVSIFSKPVSLLFFPMSLFFIYNTGLPLLPRRKKIQLFISYMVLIAVAVSILIVSVDTVNKETIATDLTDFWSGFTAMAFQLRFDGLVLVFLLPLTVGLFLASRNGIKQADSILILVMGGLLFAPLLVAFTEHYLQPYRYMPLIVFFAVGVGTLLSKNSNRP